MGLLQRASSTPEEVEREKPLDISPAEVAEMDEETWYAKAYRGDDVPQLTVRAVLMGSILGFLLAFTNLYIGLKTGWHLGVAITACILSYALWQGMLRVGLAKTPMSILENNCMQSTASAAGYSTGGTMVSAVAAMMMLSATEANPAGEHLPVVVLVLWTFFLAVLGVTLAIPMKRNMINQERLKFPSGLAAAATLQSLYASGSEASRKAMALLYSSLFGAIFPLLIDLNATKDGPLLPGHLNIFNGWLPVAGANRETGEAYQPSDWTMTWDVNPVMIAAGMIVG
ncbi:MAG: putative oligopeptide transporter (OPT) family protein, partial [Myxococcota bacterium]